MNEETGRALLCSVGKEERTIPTDYGRFPNSHGYIWLTRVSPNILRQPNWRVGGGCQPRQISSTFLHRLHLSSSPSPSSRSSYVAALLSSRGYTFDSLS